MKTSGLSVAQNSALTLGANVAAYALTFGAAIIVARVLGPGGKGTFQLVVLTHTLLATLGNLGLASANSYLIAKGQYSFAEVGRHAAWLGVGVGVGIFLLTAAGVRLVPTSLVPAEQRIYVLLAGALVPFALLTQFLNGALQGAGQIIWLNALTLAQALIYAAGTVVLLLIWPLAVPGALAAFSLSTIFTGLLAALVTWRMAKHGTQLSSAPSGWNSALVRRASGFGIRAYLASVVSFLNLRSDQFLLGYLAGTASVGQYSIAVTVAELILFFPRALSTALLPRITGARPEDAGHMAASACRHTLGATLVGLVGLAPFALLIPTIFGEQYRPAVAPCLLLAPGVAAFTLAPVLSTYFSGQLGRPMISSSLSAFSLTIDLALVWILVPFLGVQGAALASAGAYGVTVLVMVFIFRRLSGVPLRDLVAFRAADLDAYRSLLRPLARR